MEETIERLLRLKPNLKPSTAKSYIKKLECINKSLGIENVYSIDILEDKEIVDEYLKEFKNNTIKTYLGAIITLLQAFGKTADLLEVIDEYREELETRQKVEQKRLESQEKSESQEKNWVEIEELQKIVDTLGDEINLKRLWEKGDDISMKEFFLIQKYIVGMLYVGDIENNPAMRLDYAPMKIIHISDYKKQEADGIPKENSLVVCSKSKMFFEFVDYKTNKTYGIKKIPLGDTLIKLMNLWLKVNKTGSLLINQRGNPMKGNELSKLVNNVFSPTGKKIGVTLLRHIIISKLFPAQLDNQKNTANLMAHSVPQQTLYSKKI